MKDKAPEIEFCRNHHLRTPESTIYEKARNGTVRRRCRECRRESRASRIGRPVGMGNLVTHRMVAVDDLPEEGQEIVARFNRALRMVRTSCYGNPAPYMDYDDEHIPSPETAAKLCEGCPVLKLCGAYAQLVHEPTGVWGGDVFIQGSIYREGTA